MSNLVRFYIGVGALLLTLFTLATCTGWEAGSPKPDVIPASVRSSPGGYRSFHFWHAGYLGGK